jgi:hypothetical protein
LKWQTKQQINQTTVLYLFPPESNRLKEMPEGDKVKEIATLDNKEGLILVEREPEEMSRKMNFKQSF